MPVRATPTPPPANPQVVPFPNTAFTLKYPNGVLPKPADVRAKNLATRDPNAADPNRPPPVKYPELGLLVKYGLNVKPAEAEAQRTVFRQLQGRVPVPEVYGWTEDGGQGFLYMALIPGETLAARWKGMSTTDRATVCRELRGMVNAWRGLAQDPRDVFIGSIGKRPLNDVIVKDYSKLRGPFTGGTAVAAFQKACNIDIKGQIPIAFTHGDLVACNVVLVPGQAKVAAVIDWAQAGWYPSYWEYCKARWVMMPPNLMDDVTQDQWRDHYLKLVLDPVDDDKVYWPWYAFTMSYV